jgi:rhodanese-related sulfurtransferase
MGHGNAPAATLIYTVPLILSVGISMGKLTELLELARNRGQALQLPYSGALTPKEAHALLQIAPGSRLVDVRSRAELDWVGRIPDAVEIEWSQYPGMVRNPNFQAQLQQQVDKEAVVLFICRSGARSNQAALAALAAGYNDVYNVLEGFEGDQDAFKHRNAVGGWRHAGLPWYQS